MWYVIFLDPKAVSCIISKLPDWYRGCALNSNLRETGSSPVSGAIKKPGIAGLFYYSLCRKNCFLKEITSYAFKI